MARFPNPCPPKFLSTLIALTLGLWGLGSVLPFQVPMGEHLGLEGAIAKSSGGRSRGGSLQRRSTSTPRASTPRASTPKPTTRPTSTPSVRPPIRPTPTATSTPTTSPRPSGQASPSPNRSSKPANNPVVVPVPVPVNQYPNGLNNPINPVNPNNSTVPGGAARRGGFPWMSLLVAIVLLAIVLLLVSRMSGGGARDEGDPASTPPKPRDLRNDVVTITFLQIALDAAARDLQAELTALAEQGDWETPEGIQEQLQTAALAVLQQEGYWRGVQVSSETFPNREAAAQRFEALSVRERSKFSEVTLSRVGQQFRSQAVTENEAEIAIYIVVSFLVGTEDDRPLFTEKIYDSEALTQALQRLAQITPDYLAIFELLWSPQSSEDCLTEDELLCEYTDMILPL